MAEQVQLHLESRLPELNDLLKKGVFSEEHIKDIISQRTKYEYRLKRRGALKEDFLAYIQYEKQLEVERRDSIIKLGIKGRHSVSDHSIVQHIYGLYQRALVKFGYDIGLWQAFLEYAVMQGSRSIFVKGINKALKLHPRTPPLWILAARWEWLQNGNADAARKLFQRALRINHSNPFIFLSFFELEVEFCMKMIERRGYLGIKDPLNVDDHVLNGELACLIFNCATQCDGGINEATAPKFIGLTIKVYDSLPKLYEHIISGVNNKFREDGVFLASIVRGLQSEISNLGSLKWVMNFLDVLLRNELNLKSFPAMIDFLSNIGDLFEEPQIRREIFDKVDQLFRLAEKQKIVQQKDYVRWIDLTHSLSYEPSQLDDLLNRAIHLYPEDQQLLFRSIKACIDQGYDQASLREVLKRIVACSDMKSMNELAEAFIDRWITMVNSGVTTNSMLTLIEDLLCCENISFTENFANLLASVSKVFGRDKVRLLCSKVSRYKMVNHLFYSSWISIEIQSNPIDVSQIRTLFRKALSLYETNAELWHMSISFERSQANFIEVSRLIDQARRLMGSSFVEL